MRSRAPLSAIGFLAAGVVAGFVLGGLRPRFELEERDRTIAALEERLEQADTGGFRATVPGFDRILRDPSPSPVERPLPSAGSEADEETDSAALPPGARTYAAGDAGVGEGPQRSRWRDRWENRAPEDRIAAFSRAAAVQQVRRMQSRAALAEQAQLSDEEIAAVEEALARMNRELYGHGEELILLAMGREAPAARDLLGVTHDITGILHQAQVEIERVVGPERLADVDPSALEIWNHIDLNQLEPAARAAAQ